MSDYNSTRLYSLEQTINTITKGVYQVALHNVKPTAAKNAADKLRSNPTYCKPVGMWVTPQLDSESKPYAITSSSLATWWSTDSRFHTAIVSHWETVSDFLLDISSAAKEWNNEKKKQDVQRSENNSEASRAIIDAKETKSKEYPLYANWSSAEEKITTPDMDFLYNNLSHDKTNNLYWTFENGTTVPIPMMEGSVARRIMDDADFWSDFATENMYKIKEFCRIIIDKCYDLRNNAAFDDTDLPTLENQIEDLVPHCISRNICVSIHFAKIGSGKNASWCFDHFSLEMNATKPSMNRLNWCAVLQTDMLRFLDFSKIRTIKQWSITKGERSIYSYDMTGITMGRKVPKLPKMPRTFSKFFSGKLVNPIMDLLRIATFIVSVIDPDNFSRQVLMLVGLGKEGKGIFAKLMSNIFGSACVTLQELAFDDKQTFGMAPAMNKRLVILQDVTKPTGVVESAMFKSLTGNDTLSVNRKYLNTMEWQVEGSKMLVVTNKRVWLNNYYAISRVLPLFFQKNYNELDVQGVKNITNDLILEKTEFVQWCFDYVSYFKQLTNAKGDPWRFNTDNGLVILSDEQFSKWKAGELDMSNENAIIKEAFEAATPANATNSIFKVSQYDDENEDVEDICEGIFNLFFERDPNSHMKRTDITRTLVENARKNYTDMLLLGITVHTIDTKCKGITTFMAWLANREFIKTSQINGYPHFWGIKKKEDSSLNDSDYCNAAVVKEMKEKEEIFNRFYDDSNAD